MSELPSYDIGLLNRKFGEPGRIAFRAGPCGEPIAVIAEARAAAEVSLYGGHILSYRPVGHSPVLWMTKSMMETKPGKAIRGGIPVCWPWFGPGGEGRPSHGFARTARWNLLRTEHDAYSTSVALVLEDSPETRALWPHAFRLELEVTVGEKLFVSLTTENTDNAPFSYTEALHSYYRVKDASLVQVLGLDGNAYIDKAPGGHDALQAGPVTFDSETDRVYPSAVGQCQIHDTGIRRRIHIEKSGSAATVVWNPWIDKAATMKDMLPDDYKRFVCVETANAGAEPLVLAPGQSHELHMEVTVDLLDMNGKPITKETTSNK